MPRRVETRGPAACVNAIRTASAIRNPRSSIRNHKWLHAVAVADRFDVMRARGTAGRGGRANVLDDAAEIAVADGLAMLAERDHRVVDLGDFRLRQREAERLAA